MRTTLFPTALVALFALPLTAAAAQREECGSELTPELAARSLAVRATGAYDSTPSPAGSDPLTVHLAFHVVRESDGSGGLPESRLEEALDDANGAFANAGIRFCAPFPIDYIDDDAFYFEIDTSDELNALRTTNVVPDAVNCYFTEELNFCGVSSFTFSSVQGIAMKNSCTATSTNHSTFSHELGHYFDLFHTHTTSFGEECADGSNCADAGDQICDTPADPVLGSHNVEEDCAYFGDDTDECSGDTYSPQTWNYMSYSRKHCRTSFTPEQDAKAFATLVNLRPEYIQPSCDCGVTSYCPATPSSTGSPALLSTTGSVSVTSNDLTLIAAPCPASQFGTFFYGEQQTQAPFGDGFRCIDGQVFRLDVLSTGTDGIATHAFDVMDPPELAGQVTAGSTWNFQFWFRDPAAAGAGFNLSSAVEIAFCP